jgi:hypothetical protein
MLPFRMPRLPPSPIVTALLRVARGVDHIVKDVHQLKEQMMADFTALNARLDEHAAALGGAVQRVNDDVQALRDQIADLSLDTEDQAQVDAAVARVQEGIDALNAIDPVRADEPTEPAP